MSPTEALVTFSSRVNAIRDFLFASGCYLGDPSLVHRVCWNHRDNHDELMSSSTPSQRALLSTVVRLPSRGFTLTSDADWCGSASDFQHFAKTNARCLGFMPERGIFRHDFFVAVDNALELEKAVATEGSMSSSGFVCGTHGLIFSHRLFQVFFI
jgi:hypothetical protein